MRKFFKFFMCAAVMAVSFIGCSNEETSIPDGPQKELSGVLTIHLTEPKSYQADSKALVEETKVNTVDIWVFQLGKLIKTVRVDNFTFNANNECTVKIEKLPLGDVTVYAGLNMTDYMKNTALKENVIGTSTMVNLSNLTGVKTLYAYNNFPMFNVKTEQVKIKYWDGTTPATNPNQIKIGVERMVAKVYVQQKSGGVAVSAGETTSNTFFEVTNGSDNGLGFLMGQMNKKIYPFAGAVNQVTHEDPNWKKETIDQTYHTANFVDEFVVDVNNHFVKNGSEAWSPVNAYSADPVFNSKPLTGAYVRYAPENTFDGMGYKGQATYAAVRTRFCPKATYTYTKGSFQPAEDKTYSTANYENNDLLNLYVIVYGPTVYYFTNQTHAQDFIDDLNEFAGWDSQSGTPAPYRYDWYKNQFCYYYVFLDGNSDYTPYQTIRNDLYQITINNINSLGRPSPKIDEREWPEPIEGTSDLDVTIDIVRWNVVEKQVDLGY